ncbi:MAG TPA: VOC family protein [Actinomycetota bacterium]|nr:VOC family protein [Actinomycetota bacterium]
MRGRQKGDAATPRESRHDYWGVVLEAPDAPALARFYAGLLDWELTSEEADFATVGPPDGVAYLGFQTSPEYVEPIWPPVEGAQQMMLHLDFEVSDLEAAIVHARQLGASVATYQPQEHVRVMLDPVGHPFCLYVDTGN